MNEQNPNDYPYSLLGGHDAFAWHYFWGLWPIISFQPEYSPAWILLHPHEHIPTCWYAMQVAWERDYQWSINHPF